VFPAILRAAPAAMLLLISWKSFELSNIVVTLAALVLIYALSDWALAAALNCAGMLWYHRPFDATNGMTAPTIVVLVVAAAPALSFLLLVNADSVKARRKSRRRYRTSCTPRTQNRARLDALRAAYLAALTETQRESVKGLDDARNVVAKPGKPERNSERSESLRQHHAATLDASDRRL
jgi:hypothetical protein